jgi:hypothetical protein
VHHAVKWWSAMLKKHDLGASQVEAFECKMRDDLMIRCAGHWYPSDPRGRGYRSLVNDVSTDPIFRSAAAGIFIHDIGSRLPRAIMWINPASVKVHLENGRQTEIYSTSKPGSNPAAGHSCDLSKILNLASTGHELKLRDRPLRSLRAQKPRAGARVVDGSGISITDAETHPLPPQ